MRLSIKLALAAATLPLCAPAAATVLTFDDLARDGTSYRYVDGPLHYGDYVFSSDYSNVGGFIVPDRMSAVNADMGNATLAHRWDNVMYMSRADGELFDLTSIDIADFYNTGNAFLNQLVLEYGDGSTESTNVFSDGSPGLQTVTLNAKGIRRFLLTTAPRSWWQFDNIVVDKSVPQAPLPEPASWALMIAGFGLAGARLRTRRGARIAAIA